MDQLVNLVVQKTGISEQHARTAVETVLGFIKERAPEPLRGQIDAIVSGDGSAGNIGDIAKKIGGMIG